VDIQSLRATAATRMARNGMNAPLLAEILGHRDLRLVMKHYTDLRIADTSAAVEKLPPLKAAPPKAAEAPVLAIEVGSNLATGASAAKNEAS
jgi:hypothetical protein